MDLVTCEEFEVQEAVLARIRTKLQGLEERLESLEQSPAKKKATKKKPAKKTASKKKAEKKR
jgi:BMFP domain-containing protein YqiC